MVPPFGRLASDSAAWAGILPRCSQPTSGRLQVASVSAVALGCFVSVEIRRWLFRRSPRGVAQQLVVLHEVTRASRMRHRGVSSDFNRLRISGLSRRRLARATFSHAVRSDFAGAVCMAELGKFPFVRHFRFLTRFHQTPVAPVVQARGVDFAEVVSSPRSAAGNSC